MILTLTKDETIQLIHGPAGQLEVICAAPDAAKRHAWGIICHPHPLYGGTMHNKVVTTLVKTFQALGLNTVRFNFRGVGQSEGVFDNGVGELDDLYAVIEWVQRERIADIWLAGFSFGAYIAAKAASEIPVRKLVTIAPPVDNFPMRQLPPILSDWVLVQGMQDEVVPAESVIQWAESRDPQPTIVKFDTATHFFHGQLTELRIRLEEVLHGGR